METPEVKQPNNSGNKLHWLEITEYICLAGSLGGTIASFLYQQAIYAASPLTATIFLEAINRTRLQKLQQQDRQEALAGLYQAVESLPKPIMKELGLIEEKLTAQNEEQTKKLETAIAPLASDLQAVMPLLARVDAISARLMGAETLARSLKERTQSQIEELTEKLVRVKADAQTFEKNNDIERQKLTEQLSQQESFAQSLKAETSSEESKLKEALAKLEQGLKTLEPVPTQIQELTQRQEPLERQQQEILSESLPRAAEAIEQLKDRTKVIGLIEEDISKINGEIEELAYQLDKLPEATEPDFSKIEEALASLQKRLNLHPIKYKASILKGKDLSNTYLHEAQFGYANLKGINLKGSDLAGANLARVNLSGANLSQALLADANLSKAKLGGAELEKADLSYANLKGTDLEEVNLSSANLNAADLSTANLSGANLTSANAADGDLSNANLQNANLSGANFSGGALANADLSGANLSNANLSYVDLSNANLRNVNLRGAKLWNTNLTNANLAGAIVDETTKVDDRSPLKSVLQPVTQEEGYQPVSLVDGEQNVLSQENTNLQRIPSNDPVAVRATSTD
ncbi:MAG: pentapeptide repeat-containing protein [Cyanobacteriota bacterium]|nr:pentapeptide repeat-containing protein [Cyanobacteriota bacterium]